MRRLVIPVGAALSVAALVALLVLAQHSTGFLVAGTVAFALGLTVVLARPEGRTRRVWLVLIALWLVTTGAWATQRFGKEETAPPSAPPTVAAGIDRAATREALTAGLALARGSLAHLAKVRDYTCVFAKRERAKSLLGSVRLTDERLEMKIRHDPFSVYIKYLRPKEKKGTEAIYVEGANDGRIIAHSTRAPLNLLGTMRLKPTDWRAMLDQRYPITHAGLRRTLTEFVRLTERDEKELLACDVRMVAGESSAGRACRTLEISNPNPAGGYWLAHARLQIDDEWHAPVLIERWEYVQKGGAHEKRLVERYEATDIRFDVALGDTDFDPKNPTYGY